MDLALKQKESMAPLSLTHFLIVGAGADDQEVGQR
jgi:hypothetical protein